jgi:hypothetical protein
VNDPCCRYQNEKKISSQVFIPVRSLVKKIYDYVLHDISKITVPRFGCSEELIE